MITVETWQVFGGLLGILVLLGGGALALQRLGIIQTKSSTPSASAKGGSDDLPARVTRLEKDVARLDERTRKHEISLGGIGNLHKRIDGLTETSGRIEGELSQMNRQLGLVLRHLLGERES